MAQYSQERKEAILKKLLPPHSMTVAEVAESEGISSKTLYHWRDKARKEGRQLQLRHQDCQVRLQRVDQV